MKTILLVEDDQQVREVFGLALRRNGRRLLQQLERAKAAELRQLVILEDEMEARMQAIH